MGVGTGRFNRVSVWVSLHRLLLTSKAAPGARGAGTAVRSGRHRVRRPGASGPRSRVLGSVHASHRHTLSLKIVRKSDRFTLAIPMIGSCEASLRHGSVDGRHSGLASTFDNDVGRVNERGSRARSGRYRRRTTLCLYVEITRQKWQIRRLITAYHPTTDRH